MSGAPRGPRRHRDVPRVRTPHGGADQLIHDLFAVGLTLSSCASIVTEDAARRRLRNAIDDLDRIIRDVRVTAVGNAAAAAQCSANPWRREVMDLSAGVPSRRATMVEVDFVVPSALGGTTAELVAEFMAWVPLPMDRSPDGSFSVTLRLEAGQRWRYRFLVDGERWIDDWGHLDEVVDDDGSRMSVVGT